MCGIFASLSRAGPIAEDYEHCVDLIAHRGPDDSGIQLVSLAGGHSGDRHDRAWLGHRRLAIIDPDPRGAQPMATPDGRLVLIFNGEIYNYLELREECRSAGICFRTETDTEVLLACWGMWGERTLERLVGMFAFVLVDRQERIAWLARDAFGIKPLHVAVTPDRLFVSSEIPPLLATGKVAPDIDPTLSFEYIRFGASTSAGRTLLATVDCLPAASVARFSFDDGTLSQPRRYWSPRRGRRRISFGDAVAECRDRFLLNVRLHLRSDVPVGAALSGGLDSSAIVCAVKHLEPDVRLNTFSFISADPKLSEEKWVDIVNAHIAAKGHKVRPQPEDLGNDLEALVRAQGEPFGTSSIYAQYRVFRMARENGVPVTLDGQGADEMLAGYWPYIGTVGAAWLRRGRLPAVASLIWNAGSSPSLRARLAAQVVQAALPRSAKLHFRRLIGRSVFPAFLDRSWYQQSGARWNEAAASHIGDYSSLQDHLEDTLARTSLPTLLRYADRSSMAFSVESRVPFLTPEFADFMLELPSEFIVSARGDRKHVFREAMRGIVPEPILSRRDKIGFVADDGLWLRTNWTQFRRYEDEIADAPQFDTDRTLAFLRSFQEGGHDEAQQVWRIFMFAIWRRQLLSAVAPARATRPPLRKLGARAGG